MRTLALTRGAAVLIEHADEPERREALARTLVDMGLVVHSRATAELALIVRTRRADELAALLGEGATGAVAVLREDELERIALSDERPEPELDSVASLERRAAQLDGLPPDVLRGALSDLLHDPRMLAHRARARLLHALERLPPSDAIDTLASLLRAPFGPSLAGEALLLGRLAARGHSRFAHRASFAIELDDPRDELSQPLLAQLRSAPVYERMLDERGSTVHRARFDAVPWVDDEASERAPALVLLRAVSALEGARVWFAGCPLPASLPWPLWTALLGQRAGR